MKRPREEIIRGLMNEAEAVAEELADWYQNSTEPDLTQIEDVVLELRKRLSVKMAVMLMEGQENSQPVPGPLCAECGAEMRYKGKKTNTVESRAGTLGYERGYYYCPQCQAGLFPPGPAIKDMGKALE